LADTDTVFSASAGRLGGEGFFDGAKKKLCSTGVSVTFFAFLQAEAVDDFDMVMKTHPQRRGFLILCCRV
jgi:hypothetical protein